MVENCTAMKTHSDKRHILLIYHDFNAIQRQILSFTLVHQTQLQQKYLKANEPTHRYPIDRFCMGHMLNHLPFHSIFVNWYQNINYPMILTGAPARKTFWSGENMSFYCWFYINNSSLIFRKIVHQCDIAKLVFWFSEENWK